MRNKILSLSLLALFVSACGNQTPTTTEKAQQNNVNIAINKTDNSLTVSSHSQNKTQTASVPAKPENNSPQVKAVDVTKMTEDIEKAKAAYDKNTKNEEAKNALTKAYFERAFALTNAAQYRAALGDFRKGLKLDPNDEKAKSMHDEIIRIFESIGREPPKEGEEPPPMPVK